MTVASLRLRHYRTQKQLYSDWLKTRSRHLNTRLFTLQHDRQPKFKMLTKEKLRLTSLMSTAHRCVEAISQQVRRRLQSPDAIMKHRSESDRPRQIYQMICYASSAVIAQKIRARTVKKIESIGNIFADTTTLGVTDEAKHNQG